MRGKHGPTNLDLECKAALQKLLKPCNYGVIVPWMTAVSDGPKKDMAKLARLVDQSEAELQDQRSGYAASREPLLVNRHGRARPVQAAPCTADRAQMDLQRSRHGEEQRDPVLQGKRRFFAKFAEVPSVASVDDWHRLREAPLAADPAAKVLTEGARRKLQVWQVRGPDRDREAAAQVMRSLRSVSDAVAALPTYGEVRAAQPPGGRAGDRLYQYAQLKPDGVKLFKPGKGPGRMTMSHSAPLIFPPMIDPEDLDRIAKPGGDVVNMLDHTQLQMFKNKERAARSKLSLAGGERDWTTTYGSMAR